MAHPIQEDYLDKVDLRRGNKFHAVAQQIAQDIVAGKYEERLPSVRKLCEIHGVTLVTMDKAVKVLKANGLITVKHAKGMFVTRLKRKRTDRLLFVGHASDLFHAPMHAAFVSGLRTACTEFGMQLLLEHHDGDVKREYAIITDLWEREQIDGLVLWECPDFRFKTRTFMKKNHVPFVLAPEISNQPCEDCHVASVEEIHLFDEPLKLLLKLGHSQIGFVGLDSQKKSHYHDIRYQGFRESMARAGLNPKPLLLLPDPEKESLLLPSLESKLRKFTALICCTDQAAVAVSLVCLRQGIRIPAELSLVGYEDSTISLALNITSVDQKNGTVGQMAVRLLLDEIEGKLTKPAFLTAKPRLVIRGSTAEPASKTR